MQSTNSATEPHAELVSIMLPAYNHEQYIQAALDSILTQDYSHMELNIIDDGSTDSTREVIEAWIAQHESQLNIQFRSRANKGISATLNELISMSSGSFLAGLASDDVLLPDSISARVDYLQRHPNHLAVFGDYHVIDDTGQQLHDSGIISLHNGNKANFADSQLMKLELLGNFSIAGPVIMYRPELLSQAGMYDESLHFEDWDMYIRMSAQNLLGFIDQAVASYRWHDANVCRAEQPVALRLRYERIVMEKNMHLYSGDSLKQVQQLIARRKRKEFDYKVRQLLAPIKRIFRTSKTRG